MVRCRWSTFAMGLLSVVLVGAIALVAEQSPPKKDQARASKPGQAAGAAAPQKAAPAQAAPGEYVGDDAKCIECHDNITLKGTSHGREFKDRSPVKNHGCET